MDGPVKLMSSWLDYLAACWDLPMHAPACRPLWVVVMIVVGGAGLYGLIAIAWWTFKDVRTARRRRRLADEIEARTPEEIRKSKWIGDESYPDVADPDQLEQRIRDGLDQHRRKAAGIDPPHS